MSFGVWVMKYTPTPFERISRTVCVDRVDERLRGPVEEQVGLVEEEAELRLVEVADLGSSSKSSASSHIRAVENSFGLSWTAGSSRHEMIAAAVGRRAQEVGDVELRLAEELVAAAVLEPDERAEQHAHGLRREAADARELGLAGVGVEEGQKRPQVGEVEERQALLVGVAGDEPEALLLRLVRLEDLRQELRAEVAHRGAHRHAGPDPAEAQVLDREAVRGEGDAEVGGALRAPGRRPAPGVERPETSPFTSATNTETPAAESCSASTCSVRVLPVPVAPAISPCRFAMLSATFTSASWTSCPVEDSLARARAPGPSSRRRPRSSDAKS